VTESAARARTSRSRASKDRTFGLSKQLVGRSAALLFVISGAVNLAAAFQTVEGANRLLVLCNGLAVTLLGLLAWRLPWERWSPRATLWLSPVAFAAVALSNTAGGDDPWSYAAFYMIIFAWVGICHAPRTSFWLMPLFVAAYVIPLGPLHMASTTSYLSTVYVGAACLLIGESVAWVSARWRRSEASLKDREAEERFSALVGHSSDLITVVSPDATVEYCSPSVERILGYAPGELAGTPFGAIVHRDDAAHVEQFIGDCLERPGKTLTREWRLRTRDRSYRQVETVAANLVDHPQVRGVVLTSRDVTERKALEEQLSHQAFHDALTGLGNLALLRDRVSHALRRATRRKVPIALLFVDLDNFKTVNDSHGHGAGDATLTTVAARLEECVRGVDTVARLGGDEFAVLFEDLGGEQEAAEVAARIVDALAQPICVEGAQVVVGASIGVAMCATAATSADELMRNADVAMYAAKRDGKGRFAFFDPSMHGAVLERLELEKDLARALDAGELVMHYQPIINLQTGRVDTVEALVRWQHPTRGLLLPVAFLALAEETGLIVPIGKFTFTQGCRDLRRWHDLSTDGAPPALSINLSARQLQDAHLVDDLRAALQDAGVDPRYLILEITETALIQDLMATGRKLEALRALGVRLALDDFGTGYSSLSHLQRFRVDMLKVDRSFVTAHRDDTDDSALAKAIIQLGQALNLQTVAEGIEGIEELDWVRDMGCEYGQGFHLGEPMPGHELADFLTGHA
jgi:diguanylate cyclase (GGDEF)-like protein/PAS domain S-box-containing protein